MTAIRIVALALLLVPTTVVAGPVSPDPASACLRLAGNRTVTTGTVRSKHDDGGLESNGNQGSCRDSFAVLKFSVNPEMGSQLQASQSEGTEQGLSMVSAIRGNAWRNGTAPGPAPAYVPSLLWTADLGGGNGPAMPLVADGVVIDGSRRTALDAKSGAILWTYPGSAGDPATDGTRVFFADAQGFLAVDLYTGVPLWHYASNPDGVSPMESPVVADGRVFLIGESPEQLKGDRKSFVFALSAESGRELWRTEIEDGLEMVGPASDGRYVYVVEDQSILQLDARTGEIKWRSDGLTPCCREGFATTPDFVFGPTQYGLTALTRESGDPEWQVDLMPEGSRFNVHRDRHEPPAVTDDVIVWLSPRNSIYAVDAVNGQLLWESGIEAQLSNNAPVVADNLILLANEMMVTAFDLASGAVLWQLPIVPADPEANELFQPAVVDGVIYITDNAGWMYALG